MAAVRLLTDLLIPPRCPACGGAATAVWCGRCIADLAALALADRGRLLLGPGVLSVAAYAYEGVARATLLDVKLRGRTGALAAMAALLRARLRLPAGGNCAVTWVPSRRRRARMRGADVARALAGPGAVRLLRRVRPTPDQKGLPASARRHSQVGAFAATRPVPPAVVLVDDVRTTGATALAAADALMAGGARRVLVATFAAVTLGAAAPPAAARDARPGGRARSSSPPHARTAARP